MQTPYDNQHRVADIAEAGILATGGEGAVRVAHPASIYGGRTSLPFVCRPSSAGCASAASRPNIGIATIVRAEFSIQTGDDAMLIGSHPITELRFGIAEGELSSRDFKDHADVHAIRSQLEH